MLIISCSVSHRDGFVALMVVIPQLGVLPSGSKVVVANDGFVPRARLQMEGLRLRRCAKSCFAFEMEVLVSIVRKQDRKRESKATKSTSGWHFPPCKCTRTFNSRALYTAQSISLCGWPAKS
jgi:hypothetical protein